LKRKVNIQLKNESVNQELLILINFCDWLCEKNVCSR